MIWNYSECSLIHGDAALSPRLEYLSRRLKREISGVRTLRDFPISLHRLIFSYWGLKMLVKVVFNCLIIVISKSYIVTFRGSIH